MKARKVLWEKTKYKYVRKKTMLSYDRTDVIYGKTSYRAEYYNGVNKKSGTKKFDTLKEAAMSVDMHRISLGKEPVNILKRK